jgi:hypothetical protein
VAGQFLRPSSADPTQAITFDVRIPARYSVVTDDGPATGQLDGLSYEGSRFLNAGRHKFLRNSGDDTLALVWARAIECGLRPDLPNDDAEDELEPD